MSLFNKIQNIISSNEENKLEKLLININQMDSITEWFSYLHCFITTNELQIKNLTFDNMLNTLKYILEKSTSQNINYLIVHLLNQKTRYEDIYQLIHTNNFQISATTWGKIYNNLLNTQNFSNLHISVLFNTTNISSKFQNQILEILLTSQKTDYLEDILKKINFYDQENKDNIIKLFVNIYQSSKNDLSIQIKNLIDITTTKDHEFLLYKICSTQNIYSINSIIPLLDKLNIQERHYKSIFQYIKNNNLTNELSIIIFNKLLKFLNKDIEYIIKSFTKLDQITKSEILNILLLDGNIFLDDTISILKTLYKTSQNNHNFDSILLNILNKQSNISQENIKDIFELKLQNNTLQDKLIECIIINKISISDAYKDIFEYAKQLKTYTQNTVLFILTYQKITQQNLELLHIFEPNNIELLKYKNDIILEFLDNALYNKQKFNSWITSISEYIKIYGIKNLYQITHQNELLFLCFILSFYINTSSITQDDKKSILKILINDSNSIIKNTTDIIKEIYTELNQYNHYEIFLNMKTELNIAKIRFDKISEFKFIIKTLLSYDFIDYTKQTKSFWYKILDTLNTIDSTRLFTTMLKVLDKKLFNVIISQSLTTKYIYKLSKIIKYYAKININFKDKYINANNLEKISKIKIAILNENTNLLDGLLYRSYFVINSIIKTVDIKKILNYIESQSVLFSLDEHDNDSFINIQNIYFTQFGSYLLLDDIKQFLLDNISYSTNPLDCFKNQLNNILPCLKINQDIYISTCDLICRITNISKQEALFLGLEYLLKIQSKENTTNLSDIYDFLFRGTEIQYNENDIKNQLLLLNKIIETSNSKHQIDVLLNIFKKQTEYITDKISVYKQQLELLDIISPLKNSPSIPDVNLFANFLNIQPNNCLQSTRSINSNNKYNLNLKISSSLNKSNHSIISEYTEIHTQQITNLYDQEISILCQKIYNTYISEKEGYPVFTVSHYNEYE